MNNFHLFKIIHSEIDFIAKAPYKKARTSATVTINPKQKKKRIASILPAIWKVVGPTFLFGAVLKLIQDLLTFVSPQLLRVLISFVDRSAIKPLQNRNGTETIAYVEQDPLWHGILYAILLFAMASLRTLLLTKYFESMYLIGMRIRTALVGSIYKKALRLSNTARKESTVGEIVNLMSVDAQRIMDLTPFINMAWSDPIQIGLALYFLWNLLGPSVMAGS